ncbi:CDP-diacylglycerol--glycerol-3-phosphate 3-phosphatidyltransferase [Corynebacterium xerosis]|uniref:CDP-diacylglycerol--glycerol-3-phosphate 3-phosphatidyltransferase n=1 Tax=Corynebacterium xerosis TaxID=1725 RepID=A0A0M2XPT1_9CORY|nr:CDP-diacylglycerol--glycerol-3-phosphate 3-phosphatidyltransferase [Corynebacterium xerosis]SQB95568.1 CDP-diacylglycerol--glycerol-3-phosphate 3-phosphatidyltransferase [Clostridium paraputrificum]AYJ32536.1 CDP-diacylglycerol--glycerol-3-phosphate 3-phosphatidyltransferase [Corynebacterium xerosis]KKO81955.1 CDP-diacylglycerol--glycerol-3-phosphate 3-phosphatidyltransferase [Corynebacterium xerosis]NMF08328.1 CDP-diacylglycerol--glycerol-3-phosphate 3-phosphatidyltransferase [Corynebacteri
MTDQTRPAADAAPSNWNLPNALTVLRILGVPVFLWLLLQEGGEDAGWRWWAFGVFALLMITDKIDGDLARSRNLVTDFGKIADPIADKALMIGALVGLNIIELLPWWITAIIVVRELGITLWRVVQLRRGHVVPASKGGKLKTVAQSLAVALFLMPLAWLFWPAWIVMIIAVAITVVTGIQYIVDSRKAAA